MRFVELLIVLAAVYPVGAAEAMVLEAGAIKGDILH